MPISELIRDRKITPDQLAFPKELDGGGAGRSSSYQQTINAINETTTVNVTINEATDLVRGEVRQRMISERRAKAHVGSWHNSFRYMIAPGEWDIVYAQWNAIPYGNTTIETDGHLPQAGTNQPAFGFTVTNQTRGVYWIYAHLSISVSPATQPDWMRLGILKNGGTYSVVDHKDINMSGDGIDWVMRGGDMVYLDTGDVITFGLFVDATGGGESVQAPTYLYGYCTGARMTCDPSGEGLVETGENFFFTT